MRRLVLLIAFLLVPAASAHAGTVGLAQGADVLPTDIGGALASVTGVVYSSSPGEADNVGVTLQGDQLVVTAPGATAGTGCTATATGVNCPAAAAKSVIVLLGDADDHATIDPSVKLPALLEGGPGNDALTAGGGTTLLRGGDGNDTLTGGSGDDQLFGGAGDDILKGNGGTNRLVDTAGANRFVCGGPFDVLQGAEPSEIVGCKPPDVSKIAKVFFSFSVFANGLTTPDKLKVQLQFPGSAYGSYTLEILCKPAALCGGMQFKDKQTNSKDGHTGFDTFSPTKGFAVGGKRGVKPGAKIVLTVRNGAGFAKELTFTARRTATPVRTRMCIDPAKKRFKC